MLSFGRNFPLSPFTQPILAALLIYPFAQCPSISVKRSSPLCTTSENLAAIVVNSARVINAPGAKVVSKGNIVVLGSLKGNAQAGIYGDTGCFILALEMDPIQIQIGNLLAKSPDKEKKKRRTAIREKKDANELLVHLKLTSLIYQDVPFPAKA